MENKNEFQPRPIDEEKIRTTVDHFVKVRKRNKKLEDFTFYKMIDSYKAYASGEQEGEWSREEYQTLLARLKEEGLIEE